MSGRETPAARRVGITDTVLRDGHQSLLATRMRTEDMLPIAPKLDAVGFHSLEVWGGATFDTCLRYLNECPWERLRQLRKAFKQTPLQMLLRGQNLVGYRHYPDDVVDAFVEATIRNGIDIVRVFDALNDVRNMERACAAVKRAGGHLQAAISYTISPIHSIDSYLRTAREMADLGADSICLKDMAGLLAPSESAELVGRLKSELNLPVQLHCHYTSGMAGISYWTGIHAGADVVDTAMSPLAMGSSQPATETLVAVLQGTPYDTGLNLDLLAEIAEYFDGVRKRYGTFDAGASRVDVNVLRYQIPGGMISNFVSQLREQNSLHRLGEVLAEVPRVRADLGYPPLVTPTSQMVGSQSVLNVLAGGRYRMVSSEVRAYLRGLYGRPPGEVNPDVRKQVIGDEQVVTARPADLLQPMLMDARAAVAPYMETEEDVLSYCLFGDVAMKFLQERMAKETGVDYSLLEKNRDDGAPGGYPV